MNRTINIKCISPSMNVYFGFIIVNRHVDKRMRDGVSVVMAHIFVNLYVFFFIFFINSLSVNFVISPQFVFSCFVIFLSFLHLLRHYYSRITSSFEYYFISSLRVIELNVAPTYTSTPPQPATQHSQRFACLFIRSADRQ